MAYVEFHCRKMGNRGLLRYVDKLYFGVLVSPLIVTFTLAIVSLTNALFIDLLSLEGTIRRYLLSFCLIASPVICITLSHSYMAVGFSFAYFFAVLAVVCFFHFSNWYGMFLGGGCIAISMSCYQAYLGVSCVLIVIVFIQMLLKQRESCLIFKYMRTSIFGGVIGGVLYYAMMRVLLWYAHVELASYKGAGNLSITTILLSIPNSLLNSYKSFYSFFAKDLMCVDTSITKILIMVLFILLVVNIFYWFVKISRVNKLYAVLFFISILLIPAASNASLLLAVGNVPTLLMSMGMVYILVLFMVLLPKEKKIGFVAERVGCLVLALFLWISVITVGNDQLSLLEGKTATITLTQNIVSELGTRGYLDSEHPIALIGRPANNDSFAWNVAYNTSNQYAKFGCWSTEAGNNRRSWTGVLNEYCGVNIYLCDEITYNKILQDTEIASMPEFPAEGAIAEINGVVVVKVSDVY